MIHRLDDQWQKPESSPSAQKDVTAPKVDIRPCEILLDKPYQQQREKMETEIRRLLWNEAEKRKDDDSEIGEMLYKIRCISEEYELTASARENETVEDSIKNDPDYIVQRLKLMCAVSTIPTVQAILETMFHLRRDLKKKQKHIRLFRENYEMN